MARKRELHPEFFDDKTMGRLGSHVAVVYQVLWSISDDGGVCKADPATVHGAFGGQWPEYTVSTVMRALQTLSESGRVRFYSVGDRLYADLPRFLKHQRINRPSKFRHPRGGQPVASLSEWLAGQYRLEGSLSPHAPTSLSPVPTTHHQGDSSTLTEGANAPGVTTKGLKWRDLSAKREALS